MSFYSNEDNSDEHIVSKHHSKHHHKRHESCEPRRKCEPCHNKLGCDQFLNINPLLLTNTQLNPLLAAELGLTTPITTFPNTTPITTFPNIPITTFPNTTPINPFIVDPFLAARLALLNTQNIQVDLFERFNKHCRCPHEKVDLGGSVIRFHEDKCKCEWDQ